ncbi:MAG: tRNA (N6-threonylcarbamoyladenosine(37)-N6)-methyltransferase TrmO [Bacteroidetes bacterium]|nr:tRNA (N6-threonylcarbamoyladenosine(37)-N6)-methyltransferase TrmO [Bacteroidota bacterium]
MIVQPVAFVRNNRKSPTDDYWGDVLSRIELTDDLPTESLDGIDQFSHLEIVFFMDQSTNTITGSEHPRENPNWPKTGIFAQRKKDRPNHIGLTIVKLIGVENRAIVVSGLDAIDNTPVLDIKPVFREYLPDEEVKQPAWSHDLMKDYWKKKS